MPATHRHPRVLFAVGLAAVLTAGCLDAGPSAAEGEDATAAVTDSTVLAGDSAGPGVDTAAPVPSEDTVGTAETSAPPPEPEQVSCDALGVATLCGVWEEFGPNTGVPSATGLVMSADGTAVAVTTSGRWLTWDGVRLVSEPVAPEIPWLALLGLWRAPDGVDWACDNEGRVWRRVAGQWSHETVAPGVALRAIVGRDPGAVWVFGDEGTVGAWDGAAWTVTRLEGAPRMRSAWVGPDAVWAVGATEPSSVGGSWQGRVYRLGAGGAWILVHEVASELLSVRGYGADGPWIGGRGDANSNFASLLQRLDGEVWVDEEVPGEVGGVGVVAPWAGGELWMASWSGVLWWRHADVWQAVPSPFGDGGRFGGTGGLVAVGPGLAYTAGDQTLFRLEAGQAHFVGSRAVGSVNDVDGRAADDVWVVGERGRVAHWDGRRWRPEDLAEDIWLHGVWVAPDDAVWAVGDAGAAWRRDPGTAAWAAIPAPTEARLTAVWGSDVAQIWAVGSVGSDEWGAGSGVILRWDGAAWQADGPQDLGALRALSGRPGHEAVAVGRGGHAYVHDAAGWRALPLGVEANLNEVVALGDGRYLAGGAPDAFGTDYTGLFVTFDVGGTVEVVRGAHNEQIIAVWGEGETGVAVDARSHLWARTTAGWRMGPSLDDIMMPMTMGNRFWSDGERLWFFGTDGWIYRSR